jgi:hypothetical protein
VACATIRHAQVIIWAIDTHRFWQKNTPTYKHEHASKKSKRESQRPQEHSRDNTQVTTAILTEFPGRCSVLNMQFAGDSVEAGAEIAINTHATTCSIHKH